MLHVQSQPRAPTRTKGHPFSLPTLNILDFLQHGPPCRKAMIAFDQLTQPAGLQVLREDVGEGGGGPNEYKVGDVGMDHLPV